MALAILKTPILLLLLAARISAFEAPHIQDDEQSVESISDVQGPPDPDASIGAPDSITGASPPPSSPAKTFTGPTGLPGVLEGPPAGLEEPLEEGLEGLPESLEGPPEGVEGPPEGPGGLEGPPEVPGGLGGPPVGLDVAPAGLEGPPAPPPLVPAAVEGGEDNSPGPPPGEALMEQEGAKVMPKVRGKKALIMGLVMVALILVVTAALEGSNGTPNNVISKLMDPDEPLADKMHALRNHLLLPGALLPFHLMIYLFYVASWSIAGAGLAGLIQSKNKIRKITNNEIVAPTSDKRAVQLLLGGAAVTLVAAAFVLANVPFFFRVTEAGAGISLGGLIMLIAKMIETKSVKKALFPDPE